MEATLRRAVLAQALEEAMEATDAADQNACVLRTAIAASSALDALCSSRTGRPDGGHGAPDEQQQHQWLAGAAAGLLGVQPEELRAQLPSTTRTKEAVLQLLPQIERRLAQRCKQLAVATHYDSSSYDGLAAHLQQLGAAADRGGEAQSWGRLLGAARQAVSLLAEVNEVLVTMVAQYKLKKQKEADEAKAAYLHAQCAMLLEKLRVVSAQLRGATYTPATLPALRRVAQQLEGAVAEASQRLGEASARVGAYQALGPKFEVLAREHAAVQQQIADTQYQLQEVEQFARLQSVLG